MKLRDTHWSVYFLLWVTGIIALGAALGAVIFPLVGRIFETGYTAPQLARNGVKILSFYFMIWAPGIAIVACVMRAYRRRHPADAPRDRMP